jgi:hypothetical protein
LNETSAVRDVVRRRATVTAVDASGIDVAWSEPRCRGCVGCGGRCNLFAVDEASTLRVPVAPAGWQPGMAVDVEVTAPRLRQAAAAAYGCALLAVLGGVLLGHGLGAWVGHADLGAFVGLLLGTFSAGRLTKRLDAAPALRVRPIASPDS